MTDGGLQAIADGCPQIEELVLQDTESVLTDDGLVYAIQRFPSLQVLRVSPDGYLDEFQEKITDATVMAVASHCRSLKVLHLFNAALTDASIITLVNNCPLLSSLGIGACDAYDSYPWHGRVRVAARGGGHQRGRAAQNC